MEASIGKFCKTLSGFCNHLQSSCDALKQSADRRPIPLGSCFSPSPYFHFPWNSSILSHFILVLLLFSFCNMNSCVCGWRLCIDHLRPMSEPEGIIHHRGSQLARVHVLRHGVVWGAPGPLHSSLPPQSNSPPCPLPTSYFHFGLHPAIQCVVRFLIFRTNFFFFYLGKPQMRQVKEGRLQTWIAIVGLHQLLRLPRLQQIPEGGFMAVKI